MSRDLKVNDDLASHGRGLAPVGGEESLLFPSPEMLRQYEAIYPGASARIIEMAKKEVEFRRSLDRLIVEETGRGRWIEDTFQVVFGAILGAVVSLAIEGGNSLVAAISLAGIGLILGVSRWLIGRRRRAWGKTNA